jgi:tripeptide aminopeptidase
MPFLTWSRFLNTAPDAPADQSVWVREVARVSALRPVHEAVNWLRSHEREIAEFQMNISRIPAPPFHEAERCAWFCERMRELGYAAELDGIGNAIALARGTDAQGAAVAVTAHLDTVFPRDLEVNISRDQTRLYGPGISDNGAGLAALWAFAAALQQVGIRTRLPLMLVGNVGEEGEGDLRGMRYLFADERWQGRISQVLVLDGSGVDLVVTEGLGSRRFEVRISGPGGHSWSDFGIPNPIVAAARGISTLSNLALPLEPKTTISVGTIEGGTSINAIPESVRVRIDIRSAEPEQIERMELELRRAFTDAANQTSAEARTTRKSLLLEISVVGDRPAAALRANAPILLALRAVDAQLGISAKPQRASTDANIPLSLGIDALAIGGGGYGGGAHTASEWFEPAAREQALRRILLTVLSLAGVEE